MGTGQALLFASPRQRSLQPAPLPRVAALPVPVCCLQQGGPFPLVFAACASAGARAANVGKNLPPCRAIRGTAVRFSPLERLRGDRSSVPHEKKQAGHQRNTSELLAGSSALATLPSPALVQQSKGPSVASGAGGQRGRTWLGVRCSGGVGSTG